MKKYFKKLFAVFTLVVMLILTSSVAVFAGDTGAGTGDTKGNHKGNSGIHTKDPNCASVFRPAWLVYIQPVNSNIHDGTEFDYAEATSALGILSECKDSAVNTMLTQYPEDFANSDNSLANRSFVVVDKGPASFDMDNVTITFSGGQTTGAVKTYNCGTTADSTFNCTLARDDILGTPENIDHFMSGSLTLSELNSYVNAPFDSRGQSIEDAKKSFVSLFADIASVEGKINSTYNSYQAAFGNELDPVRNSIILDLLCTIRELCSADGRPEIDEYLADFLVNQNKDGSGRFYVPVVIAGYLCVNGDGTDGPTFLSLPHYFEKAYGIPASRLLQLNNSDSSDSGNGPFGDYNDNVQAFENAVYDTLFIDDPAPINKYYSNRSGSWWAGSHASASGTGFTAQAFTCMPTDRANHDTGNVGYTYFAYGGGGTASKNKVGQFKITADTDMKNVLLPGAQVAATVNIDLTVKNDNMFQEYKEVFSKEKAHGHNSGTLKIHYYFDAVKGNGASSPLLDKMVTPETLANGNLVTMTDVTFEKLQPYLKGSKKITALDKNIIISEPTTNKYIATVEIEFPDALYSLLAAGKTIESEFKASDKVSWNVGNEKPHYYSDPAKDPNTIGGGGIPGGGGSSGGSAIDDNYVEIKEGTPGHETFEAMAGVPTTENLYVGFGITEFMINVDLDMKKNPVATRTYTYIYNDANCIGHDEPCVYTCAGNHVPTFNGCGALVCHNNDPHHTHSDSCYCRSGSYSKNDNDCSDNGKWEYSYTCSCGAMTEEDSGEATWGPGYSECMGGDGTKDYNPDGNQYGCQATHYMNSTHRGLTLTGKVEQPIAEFNYLSVKGLDLWRINELYADLNQKLFSTPDLKWDPNTGYYLYYDQEDYTSGNGRLVFKVSQFDKPGGRTNNSSVYGNSTSTCPDPSTAYDTWEEACTKATQWMNNTLDGSKVQAMVVSDYIQLGTTEGYNSISYHTYKSDQVVITNNDFTAIPYDNAIGPKSKDLSSIAGNPITFSTQPISSTEFWDNNPDSAAKWKPTDITRSGYNGKYNQPGSKWNNNNTKNVSATKLDTVLTAFQPRATKNSQPHSKNKTPGGFEADGFSNLRTTKTGLDINDVMATEDRTWPVGSEPRVKNGKWDTGHCYIKAERVVQFNNTQGGTDYSDYENYVEVGYTKGKTKVNDIVVHNPVSTQNATVICNDKKYDLRTDASIAAGGDPPVSSDICPGDGTCQYQTLTCTITTPQYHNDSCYEVVSNFYHFGGLNAHQHTAECTHTHSVEQGCYTVGCNGHYYKHSNQHWVGDPPHNTGECEWRCDTCGHEIVSSNDYDGVACHNTTALTLTCTRPTGPNQCCTGALNYHVCTSACHNVDEKTLICSDPHHITPGDEWNYQSASSHYEYGDSRCWTACHDDSRHNASSKPIIVNGEELKQSDIFINIDREFKIYYPDTGDFSQQPNMHGILECTDIRGMGYYDNMNCRKWTRDKWVVFPVSVIYKDKDGVDRQASAYQPIRLNYIPTSGENEWTFYAVLANNELNNGSAKFISIASNANTVDYYDESNDVTNRDRVDNTHAARHTATKKQYIDVLGSIGGLTLEDTGDFRFATLFKKAKNNGQWLIKNLVPEVQMKFPNQLVADSVDIRNESISAATKYHDTYGTQYSSTGGKAYPSLQLPLVPRYNPIRALRNQPLRPGYSLYMDVSTIGNYYGENIDLNGGWVDDDLYYKMQVTPRYWALNLDTGTYYPLDVYMGKSTNYTPAAYFDADDPTKISEYYLYLNWMDNSIRRNYTAEEKNTTGTVVDFYTPTNDKLRTPGINKDVLGTAQRLHLNDLNRTFIGSSKTYGVNKNPENAIYEQIYMRQGQRWHFTIGLPSSSVFVKSGKPCTDANIREIKDMNAVIVCSLNIRVRGEVWTLEYDGTAINNNGIQITEGGTVYPAPVDPKTGQELKDPIVAVYDNKHTSADDLRTEGTH